MDLIWGEPIASTDAWLGKLDAVIYVPDTNRVTHIMAKQGRIFPKKTTIPLETLSHRDGEGIYLKLTISELQTLPPKETQEEEHHVIHVIDAYTPINYSDENQMKFRGVRVTLPNGKVTHLMVKDLQSNDTILLSTDDISGFDYRGFATEFAESDIDFLPTYRRDHDIESDAWEALYASEGISDTDLKEIEIHVESGATILSGNVRDPIAAEDIEDLCGIVEGVIDVENDLIADKDIELDVALLISEQSHELADRITCHAQLGMISLTGISPSDGAKSVILRGVSSIEGVRHIQDRIEIQVPVLVGAEEPSSDSEDNQIEETPS